MSSKSMIQLAATLVAGLAFSLSSHAAPTYCSEGNTVMEVSDVTFQSGGLPPPSNANDCYGILSGNANEDATPINNLALKWGSGWEFLVKDDLAGGVGTYGGITYTLSGATASTSGTWTLTAAPASALPVYVDFLVALKGSNEFALWFFDNMKIEAFNDGTWQSVFTNNKLELQDLSHLTLYVREGTVPPIVIPEPTGIALAGLALAVAGFASRRRR